MLKFQKWYVELLALAALLGRLYLFFSLIPITKNINQEMNGIRWGNESNESVTVTINGQYTNYILNGLKEDYFKGTITLSCYPEMECVGTLYFSRENGVGSIGLQDISSYHNMGTLYQKKSMSQGVIYSADASVLPLICFPCKTAADATALAEELLPE